MAYCPAPEQLVPGFWKRAPWERAVTKRVLSVTSEGSTTSLVFQAASGSDEPSVGAGSTSDRGLTGFTLFRPHFDRWYADQAVAAGVTLLTGCRVGGSGGLARGRCGGVRVAGIDDVVDGAAGDRLRRDAVVPGQGSRSPRRLQAGTGGAGSARALRDDRGGDRRTVRIDGPRRAPRRSSSAAPKECAGAASSIRRPTRSPWGWCSISTRSSSGASLPTNCWSASWPQARWLRCSAGSRMVEYSAHLLPEAGMRMVPRLSMGGLLVAGDAAGFCYTNGLTQEGMNLAMTSGVIAARVPEGAGRGGLLRGPAFALQGANSRRASYSAISPRTGAPSTSCTTTGCSRSTHNLMSALMEDLYRSDGSPKAKIGHLMRRAAKGRVSTRRHARRPLGGGEGVPVIPDETLRSGELPHPPGSPHHARPGELPGCQHRACTFSCPARCYTWSEERARVDFAYEACLECGTCLLVCDQGALDWHYPHGGYGVRFRLT